MSLTAILKFARCLLYLFYVHVVFTYLPVPCHVDTTDIPPLRLSFHASVG